MSDLIHKIVGKIIEVGQSDTAKFRLGETIRYSPSEILEILKQYESEIFSEEKTTSDLISRQAAIAEIARWIGYIDEDMILRIQTGLKTLPSAQLDVPDINVGDMINREAAIDAIEDTDWYHQNKNKDMVHGANSSEHQAWYKAEDVHKALENVPSAQPVIRCKDCKHFGGGTYCYERDGMWDENDFCSYAERKEQDDG